MKLIIQIPCLNEEQSLPQTLADLPRRIPGVDCVEFLVIDDGSTDQTAEVARSLGVDHVVRHKSNRGLASAFRTGLNACLQLGADIIVNTDGDNQYPGKFIPALIDPILADKADIVVADRHTDRILHFTRMKRLLQKLGSATVRYASGTDVPDAPCGFRAFSREAALRMNVVTDYTYTLDTIVQAGKKNLAVTHIPIEINVSLRESRLMRSNWQYVVRSAESIIRLFAFYEPLRTFAYISIPFFFVGVIIYLRYVLLFLLKDLERGAHIQSIVVGSIALMIGALIFLIGLVADILGANRRLQEEVLYYIKKDFYARDNKSSLRDQKSSEEATKEQPYEK